ncbi:MAG: Ppx/GppA family phosphatase [Hyphomicrobiales bacterium]
MSQNTNVSSSASTESTKAQGRLQGEGPVGVIDIGSNSVRLVVYERLTRSPSVFFNEKVLCGLGRGVAETGVLDADSMAQALQAMRRFRILCDQMQVRQLEVIATAAAREAENGTEFLQNVQSILNCEIEVLTGKQEAHRSALAVISGFHNADGIMGDMGGGSLEFVDVKGNHIGSGITLPLGGLRLQSDAEDSLSKAKKISEKRLGEASLLSQGEGRTFYAVGGTWRAIGRLYMHHTSYPLRVMHDFRVAADDMIAFCVDLIKTTTSSLSGISHVSRARRPLLPYGAILLAETLRLSGASHVAFSAIGVREGHLYQMLDAAEQSRDPLLSASDELAVLRARSPEHSEELCSWSEIVFDALGLDETADESRLRVSACLLSDIGWRAHPDYRGEQSLNIVAHAAFIGIDHPGRAYLALSNFYRHSGAGDDELSQKLKTMAGERNEVRARALAITIRVAMLVSAGMPGVVERISIFRRENTLVLCLPEELRDLAGDRLSNRLRQLAKINDMDHLLEIA